MKAQGFRRNEKDEFDCIEEKKDEWGASVQTCLKGRTS